MLIDGFGEPVNPDDPNWRLAALEREVQALRKSVFGPAEHGAGRTSLGVAASFEGQPQFRTCGDRSAQGDEGSLPR